MINFKWHLNPDEEYVKMIKEGIKRRNGHCPCMVQMTEATLCPCEDFVYRDTCHCNLWVKKEE